MTERILQLNLIGAHPFLFKGKFKDLKKNEAVFNTVLPKFPNVIKNVYRIVGVKLRGQHKRLNRVRENEKLYLRAGF